jgi:hypothetical protein
VRRSLIAPADAKREAALGQPDHSPDQNGERPPSCGLFICGFKLLNRREGWNELPHQDLFSSLEVESALSWDRPFPQPLPLPRGAPARTLRDAANFIKKLPKPEHDRVEWRLAVQMLIDAAEDRGPMLFARIGMLRAMEAQQGDRGRQ